MRRKLTLPVVVLSVVAVALLVRHALSCRQPVAPFHPETDRPAGPGPLPVKQVVLFNSGVGYFQREGQLSGDTQVELSFATSDINDLLKSLILEDQGGRVRAVSYDSHDPVEKILHSFALDLNNNPTFGQILNQARGEKIEATLKPAGNSPAAVLKGTIVGMELRKGKAATDADVDMLMLHSAEGMQSVALNAIQSVRFANAVLDSEFRRALDVLASAHDVQKKSVRLRFQGDGKRAVRVGYVVEQPIWKMSYRLRLEANGKLHLQGWALVDNTTDEDWKDVRMVLVSGKPISYQMNLHEPLYVPRPTVEPDLFASLRPPVYSGALPGQGDEEGDRKGGRVAGPPLPTYAGGYLGSGQLGGQFGGQFGGGNLQGGNWMGAGNLMGANFGGNFGGQMGGQFGGQFMGNFMGNVPFNPYQVGVPGWALAVQARNKLTYEELQKRRQELREARAKAKQVVRAGGLNFKEGIEAVTTAEEIGDYFQYQVKDRLTLSRQKSAMIPILTHELEGRKVSIFNERVHGRHPLLGVRLKNTSGQPLTQGPITVYDENTYAGDTRILHVQPEESRLLSYAMDLGVEVMTSSREEPGPQMNLRVGGDSLTAHFTLRQTRSYVISNRTRQDRTVIVEHPRRSAWKLVLPSKPAERSRDVYRFEVPVAAGKSVTLAVAEDQPRVDPVALVAAKGAEPYYAVASGVAVKRLIKTSPGQSMELKFLQDLVQVRHRPRESSTYFVQNLTAIDRSVSVTHVVPKGWKVTAGAKVIKGPGVYAFELPVPARKTVSNEVVQEQEEPRIDPVPRVTPEGAEPYYAVAPGVTARLVLKLRPRELVGLEVVKGHLKARRRTSETRTYFLQNQSEAEHSFVVHHVIAPEWQLVGDQRQNGPAVYSFALEVPARKSVTKELTQERVTEDEKALVRNASSELMGEYLADPAVSKEVKAALAKSIELSTRLGESKEELAGLQKQLKEQSEDQSRLRDNLKIIPQSEKQTYKRFLDKFVAQETAIENLQRQVRQAGATVQKQSREYEAYVGGLNAS
jgi:hypothetical protein